MLTHLISFEPSLLVRKLPLSEKASIETLGMTEMCAIKVGRLCAFTTARLHDAHNCIACTLHLNKTTIIIFISPTSANSLRCPRPSVAHRQETLTRRLSLFLARDNIGRGSKSCRPSIWNASTSCRKTESRFPIPRTTIGSNCHWSFHQSQMSPLVGRGLYCIQILYVCALLESCPPISNTYYIL